MWFRTLAESVVGIEIDHGVTLEGPSSSFLTSFYLHYSARVDQQAEKSMFYESMFYETSPCMAQEFYVPSPVKPLLFLYCMAQDFTMLYDTLWHIQGRSCRAQGRSCRGQGRSCRGQGRSCRQYRHTYIRHI